MRTKDKTMKQTNKQKLEKKINVQLVKWKEVKSLLDVGTKSRNVESKECLFHAQCCPTAGLSDTAAFMTFSKSGQYKS